jgi:hypothetical protein
MPKPLREHAKRRHVGAHEHTLSNEIEPGHGTRVSTQECRRQQAVDRAHVALKVLSISSPGAMRCSASSWPTLSLVKLAAQLNTQPNTHKQPADFCCETSCAGTRWTTLIGDIRLTLPWGCVSSPGQARCAAAPVAFVTLPARQSWSVGILPLQSACYHHHHHYHQHQHRKNNIPQVASMLMQSKTNRAGL